MGKAGHRCTMRSCAATWQLWRPCWSQGAPSCCSARIFWDARLCISPLCRIRSEHTCRNNKPCRVMLQCTGHIVLILMSFQLGLVLSWEQVTLILKLVDALLKDEGGRTPLHEIARRRCMQAITFPMRSLLPHKCTFRFTCCLS